MSKTQNPKAFKKIKQGPNATGPGFRTAKFFIGKTFGGNMKPGGIKSNPGQFKTQHKG